MDSILECKDLYKLYGDLRAINGINVKLYSGKIIGLLGPNGSGKTTLMKMIAGLLTPTKGGILIDDIPIGKETKSMVSYLPDGNFLDKNMKIKDCVSMFEDFFEDFDVARAESMIRNLDLDQNKKLKHLSKGNQEKVNLIMAMSRQARLYVLDEPIAGVDPAARDYIISTIINNYNPTASVIIATHLISDIENILDEVVFLKYGQILIYNSVEALRMSEGKSIDQMFREVFACSGN